MPTSLPDYYRLLEVDPSASLEVIEKAYRVLAMRHHPDSGSGTADSTVMAQLNEAIEVMRSPERRARYDRSRVTIKDPRAWAGGSASAPGGAARSYSHEGGAGASASSRSAGATEVPSGGHPGWSTSHAGSPQGHADGRSGVAPVPPSGKKRSRLMGGVGVVVAFALVGALAGWGIGPLLHQGEGAAQEDLDKLPHRSDGTIVYEAEHSYDPQYQPVVAWLGQIDRDGWVPVELADSAPEPTLSAAGFRDEIRAGNVLYVSTHVSLSAPDWDDALSGPLMRALGYSGGGEVPTIVAGDPQAGLNVSYSYETLDSAGSAVVYRGRPIAVYEGERYPGSDIPPWTLVLVTVEGL